MHRVKRAHSLRETANLGRREAADEKEAEEERFPVAGAVRSPAKEVDDAIVMASIATQLLQENNASKIKTSASQGLGLCT